MLNSISMSQSTSIKDVASASGVSTAAVSYTLNGKGDKCRIGPVTQNRIRVAAHQLNYQPDLFAREIRARRGRTPVVAGPQKPGTGRPIGLLLSATSPANSLALIPGLVLALSAADHPLIIVTLPTDPAAAKERVQTLLQDGVAGLVCCPTVYPAVTATVGGACPVIVLWQGAGSAMLTRRYLSPSPWKLEYRLSLRQPR